jgi:predicted MFS family arabinose efflux permease
MIADYFSVARRGTAIALYGLGISIGTWLGLTIGGYICDHYGWRAVFLSLGLPGVTMALLFYVFVKEPKRREVDIPRSDTKKDSFIEALRQLVCTPGFLAIAVGFALISGATSAFENWVPTWLVRVRHLSTTDVGAMSGFYQGLIGILGTLISGVLADRLGARDQRWYIWLSILSFAIMLPAMALFFLGGPAATAPCYLVVEVMSAFYTAPLFTAAQSLLPSHLRAFGMAGVLFFLNIIGSGLIPSLTGYASDLIAISAGKDGLAIAILVAQAAGFVGVIMLLAGARHVSRVLNDRSLSGLQI